MMMNLRAAAVARSHQRLSLRVGRACAVPAAAPEVFDLLLVGVQWRALAIAETFSKGRLTRSPVSFSVSSCACAPVAGCATHQRTSFYSLHFPFIFC
jgi:hypothetical protein